MIKIKVLSPNRHSPLTRDYDGAKPLLEKEGKTKSRSPFARDCDKTNDKIPILARSGGSPTSWPRC
jgi:hypothetical protein